MKTTRKTIAITFVCTAITITARIAAQAHLTGFGLGLRHNAQGEEIVYIAPESPLQESGLQAGDRILSVNGEAVTGTQDILTTSAVTAGSNDLLLRIHRSLPDTELTFTVTRGRLRAVRGSADGRSVVGAGAVAMIDRSKAVIKITEFPQERIDDLERLLDSLAAGSNGFTSDAEINRQRCDEARDALRREEKGQTPGVKMDELRDEIRARVAERWGWKMQDLVIDARAAKAPISTELLRMIRLFCKEHQIDLVREM